jgi:hypothetical protein
MSKDEIVDLLLRTSTDELVELIKIANSLGMKELENTLSYVLKLI